ncbi:hypothetical protein R3P38DRAFT_3035644, partial [Favolaschia claudopus]
MRRFAIFASEPAVAIALILLQLPTARRGDGEAETLGGVSRCMGGWSLAVGAAAVLLTHKLRRFVLCLLRAFLVRPFASRQSDVRERPLTGGSAGQRMSASSRRRLRASSCHSTTLDCGHHMHAQSTHLGVRKRLALRPPTHTFIFFHL